MRIEGSVKADVLVAPNGTVKSVEIKGGHPLLVLEAPALFDREGGLYGDAGGVDWHDNWRRFAALRGALVAQNVGNYGVDTAFEARVDP